MKPNVVWLQFDQLRTDALGCYGHSEFTPCTPNMDTIAEEGVRFTRCYCNSPVCCPSRTSQITGLYPEESGTYGNEANRDRFMPRYAIKSESPPRTIPEVFAADGYGTAIFGRPEDIRRDLRDRAPWQTSNSEGHRVPLDPVSDTVSVPGSGVVFGGRFPEDPYPSDGIADNAVAWMAGTEGPFLCKLSYPHPHSGGSCCPPEPFASLYSEIRFDTAVTTETTRSRFEKRVAEILRAHSMPPADIQRLKAYYYGTVAWIDRQVGRVLDFLERTGKRESTIIYLDADHGESLGDGGCFYKLVYAPSAHRVPRLISWKGTLPGGEVREDLCDLIDTGRTLLGLCGVPAPEQFGGRSLFDHTTKPEFIYSTIGYGNPESHWAPNGGYGTWYGERGWPRRACIRSARYRLDMNIRIDGEHLAENDPERDVFLADSEDDRQECKNLAGKPELKTVEEQLRKQLQKHTAKSLEIPASI